MVLLPNLQHWTGPWCKHVYITEYNANNATKTSLSEYKTKRVNGRSQSLDLATISTMGLADKGMAQSASHL
jgi:hypothetical protein